MFERGRFFKNEMEISTGLAEIMRAHRGFLVGGIAIGLHIRNLNYRPHDDIDIVCPSSWHESLYRSVAAAAVNYSIEDREYRAGNQSVILDMQKPLFQKRRRLVELHMLAFTEDENIYEFPYKTFIPKPFPLAENVAFGDVLIPVATVDLLLAMKRAAVAEPWMYPSTRQKYEFDIGVLEGLKKGI